MTVLRREVHLALVDGRAPPAAPRTRGRPRPVACTRGTICSGRSARTTSGRAREAHVDLARAGPWPCGARAIATGTRVKGRSTTSRPISIVAATLERVVRRPAPAGGRSRAAACTCPPSGPSRRTRRRARAARPSPRSSAPRARTIAGSATGAPLTTKPGAGVPTTPTSTGTSRAMRSSQVEVDGRRVDLLDLQPGRHGDHRRVERRRGSRCRRGGRPGRCRCRRRADRRAWSAGRAG